MSNNKKVGEKIKVMSRDALLGLEEQANQKKDAQHGNETKLIPIKELHFFKNHPYRVEDDNEMRELCDSIAKNGVITPILVRTLEAGGYEIISGHRRARACELLDIKSAPVIVSDLSDDDAIIQMVDSNISREQIKPSEKAFACKMKYDAILRKTGNKGKKGYAVKKVAESAGLCERTALRYMCLVNLNKELLDLVDEGIIPEKAGSELSFLKDSEQRYIADLFKINNIHITEDKARRIKDYSSQKILNKALINEMLIKEKTLSGSITLSSKYLSNFFSEDASVEEIKTTITALLEQWRSEHLLDPKVNV